MVTVSPTSEPRSEPASHTVGARLGFRPDLQGLRAIAVLLVVIYHVSPALVPGGYVGVDVFFVLSGFLMTAVLLRKPPHRWRDLATFWARRIRRLFPAAFLVILTTAAATRLLAPSPMWVDTARQVLASTFYVQNWVLAAHSVDYLAADDAPSPLLHYWSLSVEEQFYLVWPFLVVAALWWATRRARSAPTALLTAIGAVFAISLAVSVWQTSQAPSAAYFITPTRMWELAMGGLIAALPLAVTDRLTPNVRASLSWAGIAAIIVTGFAYTDGTPFPGYTALLPTLGTAAVILCHPTGGWSPARLLGWRPSQYLGDISYSLYLWHWPLIALLPYVSGSLGLLDKVVVLAVAVVAAGVTKVLVEDRLRRRPARRPLTKTYGYGVAGMLAVGLVGALWFASATARVDAAAQQTAAAQESAGDCFGAAAIARGFDECPQDPTVAPVPAPEAAKQDKAVAYPDGCWSYRPFTDHPTCTYGTGSVQVALIGNSHAGHWLPTLRALADSRDWTITTYLISQCAPSDARQQFETAEQSENCHAYGQWVLDQTAHGQYDLIITSNRESVPALGKSWEDSPAVARKGFHSYLETLASGSAPVVVLHDLPYPGKTTGNIPDCLAQHAGDVAECAGTPDAWHWYYPYTAAAQGIDGVHTVDLTRYFCTATTCPAVIGGVTVYFDASHMTATYARTLAPYLGAALDELDLAL